MSLIEVRVPQLSESVADATMLAWKKRAGEAVAVDEILIEIETDKVVLQVPAPSAGVLSEILRADGDTVMSQQVIALIDTEPAALQAAKPAGNDEPLSEAARVLGALSRKPEAAPASATAKAKAKADSAAVNVDDAGTNALTADELYDRYLADPGSVPAEWRAHFDELQKEPEGSGAVRSFDEALASYSAVVGAPGAHAQPVGTGPEAPASLQADEAPQQTSQPKSTQATASEPANAVPATSPTGAAATGQDVRLLGASAAAVATLVVGVLVSVTHVDIQTATPYLAGVCLVAPSLLYGVKVFWKYLKARRKKVGVAP
jgi:pyruvate/2-oxoglutarate dehydrogenase complex dihydrolipoamide acyltransferase (E2) component